MKKIILASVLGLVLLVAFGLDAKAEMAKEGTYTGKMVISSAFKSIAMGDHLILGYEYMGVFLNDRGEGFLHNASVHGLGVLRALKAVYEYDRSSGVFIDSDGDQVIFTHEATGRMGSAKATFTFHGGTGKFTGIQGGGEWTWMSAPSATEVTFQGYAIHKGHWKLP